MGENYDRVKTGEPETKCVLLRSGGDSVPREGAVFFIPYRMLFALPCIIESGIRRWHDEVED